MGRTIPIPKPNIIITTGATYAEYIAEEIKNNKCPNCGANMNLNNNHFKCEYCGGIIKN